MKRVIAFAAALLFGGALALSAQAPADLLQAWADGWYETNVENLPPEHRRPRWLTAGMMSYTPGPAEVEAVEAARTCLMANGFDLMPLVLIYWWDVDYMVYLPATLPAVEYQGVTIRDHDSENPIVKHIVISRASTDRRATLVHEATHALCAVGCRHNESNIATTCEMDR